MIAAPLLIARRRRPGATSWLIAAACLMMMLSAAAALALGRAASGLESAVAGRLIVQVIEPDRARREALAAEVMAELRARREVATMRRLGADEIERLIGPYLGEAGLADLPMPALIDVTVAPGTNVPALQAALGRIGPVTAEPAGAGLAPLAALIATLRGIALAVGAIAAAATGLVAILAARAAFAAEAPTISILHGLGATDGQIARAITGLVGRDAAIGAVIGVMLAGAAALPLASRLAQLGAGFGPVGIGWGGWLLLAALPIGLIGLAAAAAHVALLARLGRTP
jgi:cell division transport system permease protein